MGRLSWIKKIRLKSFPSSKRISKIFVEQGAMASSVSFESEGEEEEEEEPKKEHIPDPHPILALGHMYSPSRILLVAVELELFTILAAQGEMTRLEIQDALGLHPGATADFIDALVALGMLQKYKDGQQQQVVKYQNTPETGLFLDKARKQTYVGEALEECSRKHYLAWDDHGNFLKDKSREVEAVRDVIKACSTDAMRKLVKALQFDSSSFQPEEKHLRADAIFELGFGFWKSRLLLTAVEWRLFSHIASSKNEALSVEHVQSLYGIRQEVAKEFLDSLVEVKMLEKRRTKDGLVTHYANTIDGALFLDFLKPTYLGARMEYCSEELYRYWGKLPEALKTGKQQTDLPHKGAEDRYQVLYQDEERTSTYVYTMAYGIGHGMYSSAVRILDFSRFQTVVDIGGSSGQFACYIAQKNPHIQCTSTDLPQVKPIADRMIPDWECEDQVTAIASDCFKDPFPKADCVLLGMILSDWNLERKKLLIQKAYEALPAKGGALYAIDIFVDEERRENFFALVGCLQRFIDMGADAGISFTFSDYKGWCLEAGFVRVECVHILGPVSAGIAYKE
ncbi:Tetracenomycin polyketide synthesis 8-O-methyl transferase TcmO [Seminavis robusta]|uniref:Tetracenomycin polyketide synthesis 8-O-methyl transferase TcmO n=1 Tax=Seminavis robusta TaxID=568900 RepID=A0A9N8HS50_9STRA|nr:Tetracenomycin polyketide synthesis 8-O-methyl transferase TcmO [Seminavis robusta]|eukprot:Sro1134_g244940.1 Tetracenomycin polyketide synthesis 8-O-methyl transferase TcmO (566) ;mRNA; f:24958-26655